MQRFLMALACLAFSASVALAADSLDAFKGQKGNLDIAGGTGDVTFTMAREKHPRHIQCTDLVPEMLEVVALGLRSGLSFDRGFALYGSHFDSDLARACVGAQHAWSLGLTNREDALRDLAASYDSPLFARVVENMVRSLRLRA